MGLYPPPRVLSSPVKMVHLLPAEVMFRIHASRFDADQFNPVQSHRYFGGGRFDSTEDDKFSYMYAGQSVDVALSETLLRDLPLNERDTRHLPRSTYKARRISALQLTRPISLLAMRSSEELGAIQQDTWLTQCDQTQYAQSRHWAHWLRAQATGVSGFAWISRRDPVAMAYVLFGDRMDPHTLVPVDHAEAPMGLGGDFSTKVGRLRLRSMVAKFGVAISV